MFSLNRVGAMILLSIVMIVDCFQHQIVLRPSYKSRFAGRTSAVKGRLQQKRRPGIGASAMIEGVDQLNNIFNAVAAVDPKAASDVAAAADAATTAAKASSPGLYDSFVNFIEQSLIVMHSGLKNAGVPGAWGLSIILFTVLIKAMTYPLNYKQMASTFQMQALQPKLKALQSRYQGDPQKLNEMTAQLYKDENINPLAGCIPTLVQIPVFIALYRSLLDLAKKDLLTESFLWIPSLEGPVGEYNPTTGLPIDGTAWLFKNWVDGHPSMGWTDTLAYLSVPVILVISQSISQQLLQPQTDDPQQKQTQQILKFLPLMIGWFSLNVPAGLGVYWVINNVLSSFQQWFIRQQVKPATATSSATSDLDSLRSIKEASSVRLKPIDGFKANKKPETAPTPSPSLEASDASDPTVAIDVDKQELTGEAPLESKSAAKKKAKAKNKK